MGLSWNTYLYPIQTMSSSSGIVINYQDSDAFKYAPFVGTYSEDIETIVLPKKKKTKKIKKSELRSVVRVLLVDY